MKLLKNNLFILLGIFLINCIVLVSLCVFTIQRLDTGIPYESEIPTEQEIELKADRYKIGESITQEYIVHQGQIVLEETAFQEIEVEECFVKPGQQLSKGDVIGKKNETEIICSAASVCLAIEQKRCYIYTYNQFKIKVELTIEEYYQMDTSNYSLIYSSEEYAVVFNRYDYSQVQNSQSIIAIFQPENCNKIITEETVEIRKPVGAVKKTFYVDAIAFEQVNQEKMFYIKEENEIKSIYVKCISINQDMATIICDSYTLVEGLYLYGGN